MNNYYTTISFPWLGIEINPPKALEIGSFSIHLYGMIIAIGLMLAVIYAWQRSRQFGIKSDDITDGVLWIVPVSVICARLYYCIFQWDSYKSDPLSILYIWEGGLAIYGAVIGAVLGVIVYARIKKIKLGALLDLVLLGFLIGQAVGRWGNFFNREAFGAETDIFIKMGLTDVAGNTTYYHPTFLYESLWNIAGFAALHFLSKKRQYDGQIALGYVVWYGVGRTMIEGLRMDSLYWGNTEIRVSQILAGATAVAAAIALFVLSLRKHDRANLFVNQIAAREDAEDISAAEAEEEPEEEEEIEESSEEETEEETVEEPVEETEADTVAE